MKGELSSVTAVDRKESKTHHLTSLCALLNIRYEFLFLSFKFRSFPIELSLSFGKCALVLAQPLRGRDGSPEKSFLTQAETIISKIICE